MTKKPAPLPTKEQILEFINSSPTPVGKREIARAFQVKGQMRTQLRKLMTELQNDGLIDRGHKRKVAPKGSLPEVAVLEITSQDLDGEIFAKPTGPEADDSLRILVVPAKRRGAAPKIGDRILGRLRRIGDQEYEAQVIRILKPGARKVLGLLEPARHGAVLRPTDRRSSKDYFIPTPDLKDAKPGQLVLAEPMPGRSLGAQAARVIEVIGSITEPKAFSLIAIHAHSIPHEFPEAVLKEARGLKRPKLGKRTDLRDMPLVTIDGADARDFDDAVFAEPDSDPENKGGWHLLVAIADVSEYVATASALDKSALERGNSVYFPDRVVPMLPEELSNDLCSLRPDEERACLAVHMWIDKHGRLKRHQFIRGLMRSKARLTYEQVQAARDGAADEATAPLMEPVITPLYGAYECLLAAREKRGTLELDIKERRVVIDEDGKVRNIVPRERLDSHRLIEEFMITANVAAAEALEAKQKPAMYRIHEPPSLDKLEALRESLAGLGYTLAKGQSPTPRIFTGILAQAAGSEKSELVSNLILRSQSQARYEPENHGHFGLALNRYCHFTSPIRRYSDLLVHRALISAFGLGDGGLSADQAAEYEEIGEAISGTERRASTAEREVIDRYTTAFMAAHVGAEFKGRINGVTRFGFFVTLDETGADGLVPVSSLPYDRYFHDETDHSLSGDQSRLTFTLGDRITVKLVEADTLTGSMVFNVVDGGRVLKAKKRRKSPARRKKFSSKGRKPGRR